MNYNMLYFPYLYDFLSKTHYFVLYFPSYWAAAMLWYWINFAFIDQITSDVWKQAPLQGQSDLANKNTRYHIKFQIQINSS